MMFGEKLKKLRKDKNLSQQDLADKLDVHYTHLNRMENGHAQPSYEVIKKIIEIFEVDPAFLFNENEDSSEPSIKNKNLAERLKLIDSLTLEDQNAITHVIDSMLTKQKMKRVLQETGIAS
jgi:transcriptional regulator with XRE-family HTH domain